MSSNYVLLVFRYFGVDKSRQNELHYFKEVTEQVSHWFGVLIISDYIPSLRWLVKLQGIQASLHALRDKKSQLIQKLILEHKKLTIEVDQVKDSSNETHSKILWMYCFLHLEKMEMESFLRRQSKLLSW